MYCDQCGKPLGDEPGPAHAVCPPTEPATAPPPATPAAPSFLAAATAAPPAAPTKAFVPPGQWALGRPSDWPKASTLFAVAFLRNWSGTLAGVLCGWFGVPFLILMAAVGAIVGAVLGFFQTSIMGEGVAERVDVFFKWIFPLPVSPADLVPTGLWEFLTFGTAGAIVGAVYGALVLGWASLVFPWQAAYAVDPTWPVEIIVGLVGTSLCFGVGYVAWAVVFERLRLRIFCGAHPPEEPESDLLEPIIDQCVEAMGLGGRPVLLVSDSREVNAFAGLRHIVITHGLMDAVQHDREALGGVIAHELAHWRDGDAVSIAWSRGIALPLYWAYSLAIKLVKASERHRPLQMIVRIFTWAIRATVERIVIPVQARHWRDAELRADQAAVVCGHRDGLRKVLAFIQESFDGDGSGWMKAMCATHPRTQKRLARLQEPGKKYPLGRATPARPNWAPAGPAKIRTGW